MRRLLLASLVMVPVSAEAQFNGSALVLPSGCGSAGFTSGSAPLTVNAAGQLCTSALFGTTGSIGGSALTAGQCASRTVAITGATTGMAVVASPVTYPGDGMLWRGYVSASGTVTVNVCAFAAGTPTASTYNVRVVQ